ncbi:hypothetical protein J1614_005056 [Plenodomus biglobosus]|nr:hypothetical protein J1614_005056 [Plenodomus biglobosus]
MVSCNDKVSALICIIAARWQTLDPEYCREESPIMYTQLDHVLEYGEVPVPPSVHLRQWTHRQTNLNTAILDPTPIASSPTAPKVEYQKDQASPQPGVGSPHNRSTGLSYLQTRLTQNKPTQHPTYTANLPAILTTLRRPWNSNRPKVASTPPIPHARSTAGSNLKCSPIAHI